MYPTKTFQPLVLLQLRVFVHLMHIVYGFKPFCNLSLMPSRKFSIIVHKTNNHFCAFSISKPLDGPVVGLVPHAACSSFLSLFLGSMCASSHGLGHMSQFCYPAHALVAWETWWLGKQMHHRAQQKLVASKASHLACCRMRQKCNLCFTPNTVNTLIALYLTAKKPFFLRLCPIFYFFFCLLRPRSFNDHWAYGNPNHVPNPPIFVTPNGNPH